MLVLLLVVDAFSSDIIVSAMALLLASLRLKEAARPLSWLLLQEDIDETDETGEIDDDEQGDIRAVVTGMEAWVSLVVPIIEVGGTEFIAVVDRFDAATSNRKSNNSPNDVMGDHEFHSIIFASAQAVHFWFSVEGRASCASL